MNDTLRQAALQKWLIPVVSAPFTLQPMTPGAGNRRYYRVVTPEGCFVVMDSPVDEKFLIFIQIAQGLQALGVRVPVIHAADELQGFLLLSDLGPNLYADTLTSENADELYRQAFTALLRLQSYPQTALKTFDLVHYREKMQWFVEFFLRHYLKLSLTARQQQDCERLFDLLILTAGQQPKACVHYDYHCRNLVQLPDGQTGVLDFQDAVHGPVTYDLISLLRDCYIDWPASRVQAWLSQYQQLALKAGMLNEEDPQLWMRWCDFSSAQRHIKCIGLFSRFHVLGQTSDYLVYISRLLGYLREISGRYAVMSPFRAILERLPS